MNKITRGKELMVPKVTTGPISASSKVYVSPEGHPDVAVPRPDLPVPITVVTPVQPPHAARSGVVLIEVHVDTGGHVTRVRVMHSAPPFDGAAEDAAGKWTFRAARLRGTPIASVAYIAFGFPEIVTGV